MCAYTLSYSQVYFYYYTDKDTLIKKENYNKENAELWTGIVKEGLQIFNVTQNDTSLIFKSFGCTQYNDDVLNTVALYVWGRYFYESDCLCVGDDEIPCRPDTTLADLRLSFSFTSKTPKVMISKVPFNKQQSLTQIALDSLKKMKTTHYIRLSNLNRIFRKSYYNMSLKLTQFLLDYYYDLFFINDLDSPFNLKIVDFNIRQLLKQKGIAPEDFIFMNYCYHRSLVKYIKPINGKTFIGNELKKFKLIMNGIYEQKF
ncbi:MAG: hypothetical protein Kow0079_18330 [Vicingaceae bacterium]